METVTLTIDGRQVTVEKGKTVLQASIEAGISVPYYCYHPGISVDGGSGMASSCAMTGITALTLRRSRTSTDPMARTATMPAAAASHSRSDFTLARVASISASGSVTVGRRSRAVKLKSAGI